MLVKQETVDKYGATVISYVLTQGDTFPMLITPRDENNEIIPSLLISSVTFKLGDSDRNLVYEQEFVVREDGKYSMTVPSLETTKWEEGKFFYEIEVLFTDEFNATPLSYTSFITVVPQIKSVG